MKKILKSIGNWPVVGGIFIAVGKLAGKVFFKGSGAYWERRYCQEKTSGAGSFGKYAQFKADFINAFVIKHKIASVTELGCGDGNQLALARYPEYVGLDVSRYAVKMCIERFKRDKTKSFFVYETQCFADNTGRFRSDTALSLDVIYHLVEDEVFERYMRDLFSMGGRYVIIYSSNTPDIRFSVAHIKHRCFTEWVSANIKGWVLVSTTTNRYGADDDVWFGPPPVFFVYKKSGE